MFWNMAPPTSVSKWVKLQGLYGLKGCLTYVLSPLTYHTYEYYQAISSNQFNYLVKGVCVRFQMLILNNWQVFVKTNICYHIFCYTFLHDNNYTHLVQNSAQWLLFQQVIFWVIYISKCHKCIKKSKGIPRQAKVTQGVPGRLRPRIFSTFSTTRVVGHQPNIPAAFTPGEITGTHFQRLIWPQGTWFCQKEPRKKSPVTPPGIDLRTIRLVAQRLNHYATSGPTVMYTNSTWPFSNVQYTLQ
jgi:hypothetical protein